MDIFDKINNNTIVNTFKQISETGNREVSVLDILKIRKFEKRANKIKKAQENGIKAKLGRTIGSLKSLCINQNQRNLIEIGRRDFFNDHLCLQLLHSFKYLKPQSRTRYAAPAYCYCKWRKIKGKMPMGPQEQLEAWNAHKPDFVSQGMAGCAVLSLLDGITEDLTMINSVLAGVEVIPRQDFERPPKRNDGEACILGVEGPKITWYIPPLKGSATLTNFERSGSEKLFIPTLRVSRPKADQVAPPTLQGGVSLKAEEVLAALNIDCQTAYAQTDEVNKGPAPVALGGVISDYVLPRTRGVKFI